MPEGVRTVSKDMFTIDGVFDEERIFPGAATNEEIQEMVKMMRGEGCGCGCGDCGGGCGDGCSDENNCGCGHCH